jgi:hypothetical protein
MELVPLKSAWPNTITFPRELREAIPDYGPRALVFDAVSGSHYDGAVFSALLGKPSASNGARACLKLLVHETGKLDGKFHLHVDLDAETTRALGKFLIDLADQAESHRN